MVFDQRQMNILFCRRECNCVS